MTEPADGTVRYEVSEGVATIALNRPEAMNGLDVATKEGRGIVMRVPLEGGGRLVVELNAEEAGALGDALKDVVG